MPQEPLQIAKEFSETFISENADQSQNDRKVLKEMRKKYYATPEFTAKLETHFREVRAEIAKDESKKK